MKKTILLSIAVVIITLISCKNENQIDEKRFLKIENASWLIGEWNNSNNSELSTEIWKKQSDSIFDGNSFTLKANDTIFKESMSIVQKNDSLFYNVKVSNQNNGETVSFYATKISEVQIVFENPKHDFPTKIVYNKINNDSIVAGIYGGNKYISFPMKKKKQ